MGTKQHKKILGIPGDNLDGGGQAKFGLNRRKKIDEKN